MALNKRDRCLFRWSKSELPDDINTQVLLLGITRYETTPSPVSSLKFAPGVKHKGDELNASVISTEIGIYQSIEQLNKTTGCFSLERHKPKKSTHKIEDAINASNETHNQLIDQKTNRNHFNRLFERFHSKRIHQNLGVDQTKRDSIEHKAFYRWLNRTKRFDADRTPVIRKCSTKSNSIRKTTKKSTKPSRLSCIPYCVASSRNDSIAGNSFTSSQRLSENCKRHSVASTPKTPKHRHRLPTSNDYLMHSHCKSNKHCSPSNKNADNNHNNNCSLFNNLNIMDRSVDSIGSCSLDVDAESTDFSDTSGSLNVCTPSSGKDFTREFTSRIHERCQYPIGQKQQSKTVLDPNSGKISTILSQNVPTVNNSPTSPVKKPSYLNLACCVNGYSNLTTYDSKFRQSINKSREVSPIRPITYAVQYNRNGDNNYLSVPISVPINDNIKNYMMDAHTILSPEKRFFSTQTQQKSIEINGTNHDVADNVNSNGCSKFFARSMLHTTSMTSCSANTSMALVRDVNQDLDAKGETKSFIQQRVERLHGPTAVTQGLYSPRKPKSADENQDTRNSISSVLVEKSQNSSNVTFQSTKYVLKAQRNGHINGFSSNRGAHDDENINLDSLNEALPVLRHLRPEFRAQLPTLSPKRTIAISKLTSPSLAQSQTYTNGTSVNGKLNISTNILSSKQSNGVGASSGDIEHSTFDVQSHKQHQLHDAPTETIKNGCLTSNKSNDIDIDYRQNPISSQTNGSASIALHLETRNQPKTPQTNDNQDNTTQIASEMNKQMNCLTELQNSEKNSKSAGVEESATNVTTNTVEAMDANGNHKTDQQMDAQCYLNVVHAERDRLIELAVKAETELDELLQKGDVEEEVLGYLRSAAGKARLLATKKFKQFEGLCIDSIDQITREMPPPTPDETPPGFWEMVYLQVENVEALFAEIDKIRANGWKKPVQAKPKQPQGSKLTKRPVTTATSKSGISSASGTTKKSATAIAAAQKREAQRKQLIEMRRKNKIAMSTATDPTNDDIVMDQTEATKVGNNAENETDR